MSFAVKYEARLEDGTLISKSDGVEFTVGDGSFIFPVLCAYCSQIDCWYLFINDVNMVSFSIQVISVLPWRKL